MMESALSPRILVSTDRPQDLTIVTVKGSVTFAEVRAHIVNFLGGEPTALVLWDIREGSLQEFSAESMRMLVSAGARDAVRRAGGRTAIVCPRDLDYGMSRMFQTIAELQSIPFEISVFRDIESAHAWLGVHASSDR